VANKQQSTAAYISLCMFEVFVCDVIACSEQYCSLCLIQHRVVCFQAHFSRGLSIGTEDFSLDDFDPCRK